MYMAYLIIKVPVAALFMSLEYVVCFRWFIENLKSKLDDYVKQFKGKVKLHRNSERVGLIGTRTNGARYATGDVIVFLDAHCECQPNWLAPLLTRIAYDRYVMLCGYVSFVFSSKRPIIIITGLDVHL